MDEHLLEIQDLAVSFYTPAGEVKAVNGVSFTLDRGKVLGIVGESGSGKSVSVNALMQMIEYPGRIKSGEIRFDEKDIRALDRKQMRMIRGKDIGMIFQDPMTS
ncbi:MAG: ATP-binding cassette domain-containing protein, partial [Clostridia bacterium]|nr:ATP-binding cassette domain-containing protein [Clostridia bacterium]